MLPSLSKVARACHLLWPLMASSTLVACQTRFATDPVAYQLPLLTIDARAEQLVAIAVDLPDRDSARAFERSLASYTAGPGAFWLSAAPPQVIEFLRERARAYRLPPVVAGDPGVVGALQPARLPVAPEYLENPPFFQHLVEPLLRSVAASKTPVLYLDRSALSDDNALPEILVRLRRDFGWDGVVALDVRGLAADRAARDGLAAIEDGVDLLITEHPSIQAALRTAAISGELSRSRLDEATRRVIELKRQRPRPGRGAAQAPHDIRGGRGATDRPVIADPGSAGMAEARLAGASRAIREAIGDSVITAAALAVGRQGRLVALEGFGQAPNGEGVDAVRTLFDLASLSKVIGTTTAVGQLIDKDQLRLDEPVSSYLPGFSGAGKEGVTIRHLLSHTSGLPSGLWLYGSADSEEEAIAQVLRQPLVRAPGEAAEYSDLGMIILAEVVEAIVGMPLDDYLAQELFLPLGMWRTMYLPPAGLRDETIPTAGETERPYPLHGVVHDANAYRLGGVAGHAGLFAPAGDVAKFAQMMLNGGSYGEARVLSDSTVAVLTAAQPGTEGRALGWDTPDDRSSAGRYFSESSYGHTGYTGTSLWIDPERDLFVVLLTNRTYPEASAGEILDLRIAVHEAVAQSITDEPIARRPGAR